MSRRSLLAVAGWLAAAGLATLIGLGAIQLVGESITGTPGGVRSQEEVARALAASPGPVPVTGGATPGATPTGGTPSAGTGSPTPGGSAPSGARRGFSVSGGTAVAECVGDEVRLLSWAPAQGYRVTDVDRGPDDDVEVTFEGAGGEFELKIECVGGQPVAEPTDD